VIPLITPATLEYIGNNTASVFAITFPTYEVETIEAVVTDAVGISTDLSLTTDYTLDSVGLPNTNASLTLVSDGQAWLSAGKLKTGYTLYIKFSTQSFQPARFRDLGRFSPEVFEKTLDRLTMNVKAIKDVADRALQLEIGSGGTGLIPPLAGNANKILVVNPGATAFVYGPTVNDIIDYKNDAEAAAVVADVSADAAALSAIAADASADAAALDAASALSNKNLAVTAKNDAQTAAAGAAVSQIAAAASAINAQVFANNADASADAAAASALDAATAEGFKDDAELAATASAASASASAASAVLSDASADASASSALDSQNAAVAADASATDAEDQADISLLYAIESENSAINSEIFSERLLWESTKKITFADSPYYVDPILDRDVILSVDDTAGQVLIYLPDIAVTDLGWECGVFKPANSPLPIVIYPDSPNTINGSAFINIMDAPFGATIYAGAPTNWIAKFFIASTSTIAGSSVPSGGIAGDLLIKQSNIDGDVLWEEDPSVVNALIFG
jgi:hypothetical protein